MSWSKYPWGEFVWGGVSEEMVVSRLGGPAVHDHGRRRHRVIFFGRHRIR